LPVRVTLPISSWPGHSRSKNGVASLAYGRSKNGVASLAYGRSKNGVASLAYGRSKNGVASLAYVPAIYVFKPALPLGR
jgi:hypothetical protein